MLRLVSVVLFAALLFVSCSELDAQKDAPQPTADEGYEDLAKATFAGGCFWCMEPPFEKLDGVKAVISGYTGGQKENPTYKEVASGRTSHLEAVQVIYDPKQIDYEKLLAVFWRQFDPTDAGGSFVDRGAQYTSAIFYHDDTQESLAQASKKALDESDRYPAAIVTEIRPLITFYAAEDYHQDFYKKSTAHYKSYRMRSGRDQYIQKMWGDEPALDK